MTKKFLLLLVLTLFIISGCKKPVCGNGIVEKGETMQTCCEDTGCLGEQICEFHKCVDPVCEKCQYLQNHICIYYKCCKDDDCDDNDSYTKDVCVNPKSLSASCSYSKVKPCENKTWDFIASDDPNDYLGNYIGYESPSDWKHYSPLINKVNELTAGLTDDRDKVVAISNWVIKSKEYQEEGSVANKYGTIIDIFNADEGVCLDAAYLTTAMFRLAGIPARAVAPWKGSAHELTEFYIDGVWYYVDTTFSDSNVSFPVFIDNFLRYTHDYSGYYRRTKNYEFKTMNDLYVFSVKTVYKDGYGIIHFPIVSKKEVNEWYEEFSKGKEIFPSPTFLYRLKRKEKGEWKNIWQPGFYNKLLEQVGYNYRTQSIRFEDVGGWIRAALPEGDYRLEVTIPNFRIECESHNISFQECSLYIAYSEFTINSGETTIVYPESFKKIEGPYQKYFEEVVDLMKIC
jgi:hypothetical protein